MIHSYAVKFYNGQDWITFKVFNYRQYNEAVICVNTLCVWAKVQIFNTVTQCVEYERKPND